MAASPALPKVVILCGGRGARFREETELKPKPMIEVGNRPILWHLMKLYATQGFRNFVLCLGYKGSVIKEYFLNYEAMNNDFTLRLETPHYLTYHGNHQESDWTVTLADTGESAQTGARVKRIRHYITEDEFMLTYGDGLADIDLCRLLAFHRRHKKLATITAVRQPSRFGALVASGRRVKQFLEKSSYRQGLVNGGFFIFNRSVFRYLSDQEDLILEREPLERLAKDGQLMMYRHDGYWQCMDTYRDWQSLSEVWSSGKAPWKCWK